MIERIRQILDTRALSPTQFADTIGIGRPVVSHILSGRNKPSLEVMHKIIDAFPDLALPWLLKGEGPMLASSPADTASNANEAAAAPVASTNKKKPRLSAPAPSEPISEAIKPEKELMNAPQEPMGALVEEEQAAVPSSPAPAPAAPTPPVAVAPAAAVLPAALAAAPADKAIRRIIIFYQDGTFTDYQPEK